MGEMNLEICLNWKKCKHKTYVSHIERCWQGFTEDLRLGGLNIK